MPGCNVGRVAFSHLQLRLAALRTELSTLGGQLVLLLHGGRGRGATAGADRHAGVRAMRLSISISTDGIGRVVERLRVERIFKDVHSPKCRGSVLRGRNHAGSSRLLIACTAAGALGVAGKPQHRCEPPGPLRLLSRGHFTFHRQQPPQPTQYGSDIFPRTSPGCHAAGPAATQLRGPAAGAL